MSGAAKSWESRAQAAPLPEGVCYSQDCGVSYVGFFFYPNEADILVKGDMIIRINK